MKRTIAAMGVLLWCAAGCDVVTGSAGCTKDGDCKGDRVCVAGACVEGEAQPEVPAPAAVAVAQEPAPVATRSNDAAAKAVVREATPAKPVVHAATPVSDEPVAASAPEPAVAAPAKPEVAAPAKPEVAAPAKAEKAKAKRYAATIRGVCEKFVDCGCEASIASCEQTVGGQTYAKEALQCVTRLDCGSMCGRGPARCVEKVAAAEAAISREAHEMGRRIRENWPTGDSGTCPPGTHRSGGYCYSN